MRMTLVGFVAIAMLFHSASAYSQDASPAPAPQPSSDDPFGDPPAPAPAPQPPSDNPFGDPPAPAPAPQPPSDNPFGDPPAPAPAPQPPSDDPFGDPPAPAPAPQPPSDDPFGDPPAPAPAPQPPAPQPTSPAGPQATRRQPEAIVFVGTYTRNTDSEGIYALRLNLATGELQPHRLIAKTDNPSFLAFGYNHVLYAVNETNDYEGEETGAVSAFHIDPVTLQSQLVSIYKTHGGAPCHLSLDRTGRNLLVANYMGGNIALFPVRTDGGLLNAVDVEEHSGSGPVAQRQSDPHAHSVHLSPDNRFALAADLGADRVFVYRFDADSHQLEPLSAAALPPGSGPRHMAFWRNQLFVLNELAATLTRMSWDRDTGSLKIDNVIATLPEGFTGRKSTAEVVVDQRGQYVYASNRGHDSIAVFRNGRDGLELVEIEKTGGQEPRNFALAPGGKFLLAANQKSDTVQVFAIDPRTGALEPTPYSASVPSPVCLRMRQHNFDVEQPLARRMHVSGRRLPARWGVTAANTVNQFGNLRPASRPPSRGVRWATPVK